MAPRKIGKYQILQRIATGTQGTVDRAFDPDSGKQIAVKTLRFSPLNDDSFIKRFRREARLAASVDHPNVVRIFDTGQDRGRHFIAMEFLPETLHELNKRTEFSVDQVALLAIGIANGLGAIHALGIVHRDMKPHNVLITQDGTPKISDFGIARDETQATITQAGVMMGTPHYMSPEQADGSPADARSDVYALGCMTYQMLTGEVPFRADTPIAVLRKHIDEQPRSVAELNPDVPPALVKVVERAMAKDPQRRYSNGAEMARALREARRENVAAKISAISSPSTPPTWPKNGLDAAISRPDAVPNGHGRPVIPVTKPQSRPGPTAKPNSKSKNKSPSWLRVFIILTLLTAGAIPTILAISPLDLSGIFATTSARKIEVVHWSTSHLLGDGLLPDMAMRFNGANFRTESGRKIEVQVYNAPSDAMLKYLVARVESGTRLNLNRETNGYVVENIPDPVILTPSSDHWLIKANYQLGAEVVDVASAQSIVQPLIGIVTYKDMAECLGWPQKEIGFADIIALRDDPNGWATYPCAEKEWGQRPLLAFTDPTTSSTGRSLLLGLYSIAANKAPENLTVRDVDDPTVVEYVKNIQRLIDHYQIGTTVLNTKVHQGKQFGHFFIMPEDNLVRLYEGTAKAIINGEEIIAPPIQESMVMIYPEEGSMPRNNCACIVNADWVSHDQAEAAQVWVDFLLHDQQQRTFMAAGLRPGTGISPEQSSSKITPEFGLNPDPPRIVLNPSRINPAVAAAIDEAWVGVKRSAIVTLVVDTSESMLGEKLQQAKIGLKKAVQAMPSNNQLGLLTFGDHVRMEMPVVQLSSAARSDITRKIDALTTDGQTALYDAIKAGVAMTDATAGDPNAMRVVVVMTDGQANMGETRLDDVIRMSSRSGTPIEKFSGMTREDRVRDQTGRLVEKADIVGSGLALETEHPIQIFFIGIGDDADIQVGRMLAEATSAEFIGVAEDDLANLLEKFSKYF